MQILKDVKKMLILSKMCQWTILKNESNKKRPGLNLNRGASIIVTFLKIILGV